MITIDAFIALVCTLISTQGHVSYQSCAKDLAVKCEGGGKIIVCSEHIQKYVKHYRESYQK